MRGLRGLTGLAALAVVATGVLAGCDNGASAVETRDRTGEAALAAGAPDGAAGGASSSAAGGTGAGAAAPTPVTANRRETADAKVERLYRTNGADFGARSADDYLARMRAFTGSPPRDVDTARRPNGDTLYYQASTNTFAVVDRDGVPRTMFKPRDGAAYWEKEKAAAPTFGQRRGSGSGIGG